MSRRACQRLLDVRAALDAIGAHTRRGDLSDGLVFDAVRVRLIEIGEAVKALPDEVLAGEPSLPWSEIARMRDHLAHRYFDTTHSIVAATVSQDLPELRRAIDRLLETTWD
ncbi:HepT-like ribonuclease domain-containing protein [Kineococcus sp. SYSU DK001]|uniref:HepT-like ribonuclease domain-containing protein n=1 Tax=Kineococcus sp. SYSU DK001 TaxID=3383122 RepID=UPI003D7DE173